MRQQLKGGGTIDPSQFSSAGVRGLQEAWQPSPVRRNQKPLVVADKDGRLAPPGGARTACVNVEEVYFGRSCGVNSLMTPLCVEEIISPKDCILEHFL